MNEPVDVLEQLVQGDLLFPNGQFLFQEWMTNATGLALSPT